jgi:hypothetical protein
LGYRLTSLPKKKKVTAHVTEVTFWSVDLNAIIPAQGSLDSQNDSLKGTIVLN